MKKILSHLVHILLLAAVTACGAGQSTGPRPSMPLSGIERPAAAPKMAATLQFSGAKPELRDYTKLEVLSEQTGKTVLVYGVNFEYISGNNILTTALREHQDVSKLIIQVDSLKIAHPLMIAGGVVEIVARRLEFAADGAIDVSGKDGLIAGEDGQSGGIILLDVGNLVDQSIKPQKRFILNGGRGAEALAGSNGKDGMSVKPLHGNVVYQETRQQKCETPAPTGVSGQWASHFMSNPHFKNSGSKCRWIVQSKKGSKLCPRHGSDAVGAGRPGSGGSKGQLISLQTKTTLLSAMVVDNMGLNAKKPATYLGGKAGLPRRAVFETVLKHANGSVRVQKSTCDETRPGLAKGPEGLLEEVPAVKKIAPAFSSKVKMMSLQLQFATDLQAKGYIDQAQTLLMKLQKTAERSNEKLNHEVYLATLIKERILVQVALGNLLTDKLPLKTEWRDYKNLALSYLSASPTEQQALSEVMAELLNEAEIVNAQVPESMQLFAAGLNALAIELSERLLADKSQHAEDFEAMMVAHSQRSEFLWQQLKLHGDSQSIAQMRMTERQGLVSILRLCLKVNDAQMTLWYLGFQNDEGTYRHIQNALYQELLYSMRALAREAIKSEIVLASDWLGAFDLKLQQVKQSSSQLFHNDGQALNLLLAAPMEVEFQL